MILIIISISSSIIIVKGYFVQYFSQVFCSCCEKSIDDLNWKFLFLPARR